jgi:hypothetical protein
MDPVRNSTPRSMNRPRTYSPDRPRGNSFITKKRGTRERSARSTSHGESKQFAKKAEHKIPPVGEIFALFHLEVSKKSAEI